MEQNTMLRRRARATARARTRARRLRLGSEDWRHQMHDDMIDRPHGQRRTMTDGRQVERYEGTIGTWTEQLAVHNEEGATGPGCWAALVGLRWLGWVGLGWGLTMDRGAGYGQAMDRLWTEDRRITFERCCRRSDHCDHCGPLLVVLLLLMTRNCE
jgi:hypothetical protein